METRNELRPAVSLMLLFSLCQIHRQHQPDMQHLAPGSLLKPNFSWAAHCGVQRTWLTNMTSCWSQMALLCTQIIHSHTTKLSLGPLSTHTPPLMQFQTCTLKGIKTRAEFILAGMTARDEGSGRILPGDNRRRSGNTAADHRPLRWSLGSDLLEHSYCACRQVSICESRPI